MAEQTITLAMSEPLKARRLEGKVVLITGGGGAIGLESADRMLREGAKVALVDIKQEALDAAANRLKGSVPKGDALEDWILTVQADVTSTSAVTAYTKTTVEKFGRLDCAFINAGMTYPSTSIFDTTEERFDEVMKVNVKSAFLGLREAAIAMKELGNGGSIILTSSIAGLRGTPGLIVYSGSKFALRGMALTAANELGVHGIRVNTIHPSGVDSPMFREAWSEEKIQQLLLAQPLRRFAHVKDIAGMVSFLASDDSSYMTGSFFKVDGGCINF
ncbi:putative 2,5-dichloro-2,5-cyclohexadiene-1,4-diol dehydrogenase [Coniochaeta ligniaria NRRL 30616]|uniref:Putative 2,5-dichloro-2,5-cyclohexadiene-1,4-diol dehydrogenase n=1 Tax=Coniochaeta ligniaria NRRL 30616 TaxID=1408157 RepID=A0A1J7IZW9_9PEZI|nr:putative 2,5-dichloro-2,5-cyclohexadiene-1,4-diol dehydrogenase [Coniochaeta ligniaria NRRL 30616]